MTVEDQDTQSAVETAFKWVHRVYRESRLLLNEATDLLGRSGFESWYDKPESAQGDTTYLLAKYFSTPAEIDATGGTDIFVAISLYPDGKYRRASGARLVVGTVLRTREDVGYILKVVNVAARAPGTAGWFRIASGAEDDLVVCVSSDAGRAEFPGIELVRSVALPLTCFRTSNDIDEVVCAVVRMRDGDDTAMRELLGRFHK